MIHEAYFQDVSEKFAPPADELLQVAVVGQVAILTPVKQTVCDNKTTTYEKTGPSVCIDAIELYAHLAVALYGDARCKELRER
jgi:hypothetical protein